MISKKYVHTLTNDFETSKLSTHIFNSKRVQFGLGHKADNYLGVLPL